MGIEALAEFYKNHFKAIDLCMENELQMQALILIYSGIDIFSVLGRPREKEQANRQDYIKWCEQYMLPNINLPCTGMDLYSARCGIVHTSTMHSQLSKNGKAKAIIYSWGIAPPEALQSALDESGKPVVAIHIDSLITIFKQGVENFFLKVGENQKYIDLVLSRAANLLRNRPIESFNTTLTP